MEAETNAVQALQEQQILQVTTIYCCVSSRAFLSRNDDTYVSMQDSTAPWWADGDYDDVRADRLLTVSCVATNDNSCKQWGLSPNTLQLANYSCGMLMHGVYCCQ